MLINLYKLLFVHISPCVQQAVQFTPVVLDRTLLWLSPLGRMQHIFCIKS